MAVLLYVTYQGEAGEVQTLQRTGVEMNSDPATNIPDAPTIPVPSEPTPAPNSSTTPVVPGEQAPSVPVPVPEGNQSK